MIVGVAIKFKGKLYTLPRPNRHHNVIKMIVEETHGPVHENEQGFVTDVGRFLTREEAVRYAIASGQLPTIFRRERLFSEDLW